MLTSYSVENYRAFSRPQNIEIRPLTLFFGWNSGGKSALVRFLPLLAESIRVDGPPIWLAGEVGRRATWPELVCKSTQRGALKFSLSWSTHLQQHAKWEIAGDIEGRWQEAKSLEFSNGSETWEIDRGDVDIHDYDDEEWTGLVPIGPLDESWDFELGIVKDLLNGLSLDVQWISGLRTRPPRVSTYGGGAPPNLRSDGGDTIDHLVAAQQRSTAAPLLEAARSFFSALGEQLILDSPMDGAWRVMLHPVGAPQLPVNLCDTGEGYAQVLPVLVALGRACLGGPRLLCLEQPELHLHTRAQVELSKQLVKTATHSYKCRVNNVPESTLETAKNGVLKVYQS